MAFPTKRCKRRRREGALCVQCAAVPLGTRALVTTISSTARYRPLPPLLLLALAHHVWLPHTHTHASTEYQTHAPPRSDLTQLSGLIQPVGRAWAPTHTQKYLDILHYLRSCQGSTFCSGAHKSTTVMTSIRQTHKQATGPKRRDSDWLIDFDGKGGWEHGIK